MESDFFSDKKYFSEEEILNHEDFSLVHVKYNNNLDISNKLNDMYSIAKVIEKESDSHFYISSCCFSNSVDNQEESQMSKEEMLIKFGILYGKNVEYEIEYECGLNYSDMKISYRGKIRK